MDRTVWDRKDTWQQQQQQQQQQRQQQQWWRRRQQQQQQQPTNGQDCVRKKGTHDNNNNNNNNDDNNNNNSNNSPSHCVRRYLSLVTTSVCIYLTSYPWWYDVLMNGPLPQTHICTEWCTEDKKLPLGSRVCCCCCFWLLLLFLFLMINKQFSFILHQFTALGDDHWDGVFELSQWIIGILWSRIRIRIGDVLHGTIAEVRQED